MFMQKMFEKMFVVKEIDITQLDSIKELKEIISDVNAKIDTLHQNTISTLERAEDLIHLMGSDYNEFV